jgi:hypothetical protein
VANWNTMYNRVSDGMEPPHFLLTSQTVFEYYENSQVGLIRYEDSRLGDLGFDTLAYKGKPVLWDPNITTTTSTFFINTDYFKMEMMADADFMTTPFIKPDNQAARTAQILWMGNLTTDNRRRLGVVFSQTAPA